MGEIKFTELKCQRCGGELEEQNSAYVCACCGKRWQVSALSGYAEMLKSCEEALRAQRAADIANLRRLLWAETHKEYVSNRKVESVCYDLKKLVPDDFYANFYLATCSKKKSELKNFIFCMDIDEHFDDVSDMLDYILKGLKPEWTVATADLIDRAYKENDEMELYNRYVTKFEAENEKIESAVYISSFPRDAFIAYSSKDMPAVERVTAALEEQKLTCFVAAKNLRHGSGAADNYEPDLKAAIKSCKVIVFISSDNSRDPRCDALKELNYVKEIRPDMPRVEYLLTHYSNKQAELYFKDFFSGLTWCTSVDDLVKRVIKIAADNNTFSGGARSEQKAPVNPAAVRGEKLKRAKMCVADGKYPEAIKLYEEVKNEAPDDMEPYIGLIRAESRNYTVYEGEQLEHYIVSARTVFKDRILHDADYKQFAKKRAKILKPVKPARVKTVKEKPVKVKREKVKREKTYKTARKTSNVTRKIKKNGGAIFCVLFGIVCAAVLATLIAFSVINGNAYFVSLTVGFAVFIASSVICLASLYNGDVMFYDIFLGGGLGVACFFLIWYNQVTILCVFFISIGFLLPIIIYFIAGCCGVIDDFELDEGGEINIGCFVGGLVFFIWSLCLLCCSVGFGEYKVKDGEFTRYNAFTNEVVTVPDGVTSIGEYAFGDDGSSSHGEVVEIILPEGLTYIGDNAFSYCENLTTINIPESVTYVSPTAFEGTSVKELYLPAGVTESVAYLKSAESYTVSEDNTAFYMESGCLVRAKDNCLVYAASDGSVAQSITSIAEYAFSTVSSSAQITFPEGISTVEANVFTNCSAARITIGSGVTAIRANAFYNCYATEIIVQEGVSTIESGAFYGCQPQKLTVPFIGCYKNSTSARFGDIFGTSNPAWFTTYKDDAGNRIPNSLTSVTVLGGEIYAAAFNGCKKVTQITLGSGVTSIGTTAFYNCDNLTSLYIYEGLSNIEAKLFYPAVSLDIFYSGSQQSWENITKADKWNNYLTASMHYEYDM